MQQKLERCLGTRLGFLDAICSAMCNLTIDHISEWFHWPDSHVGGESGQILTSLLCCICSSMALNEVGVNINGTCSEQAGFLLQCHTALSIVQSKSQHTPLFVTNPINTPTNSWLVTMMEI